MTEPNTPRALLVRFVALALLLGPVLGCAKQAEPPPPAPPATQAAPPAETAPRPEAVPPPSAPAQEQRPGEPAPEAATPEKTAKAPERSPAEPTPAAPAAPEPTAKPEPVTPSSPASPPQTETAPPAPASPAGLPERPQPEGKVALPAKLGTVTFDHQKHAGFDPDCNACHHESRPEKPLEARQQACRDCHTQPAVAPMKTSLRDAHHDAKASAGTCIQCHKDSANAGKPVPVKCADCHQKAAA